MGRNARDNPGKIAGYFVPGKTSLAWNRRLWVGALGLLITASVPHLKTSTAQQPRERQYPQSAQRPRPGGTRFLVAGEATANQRMWSKNSFDSFALE